MQKPIVDQRLSRHCQFIATGVMITAAMEEAKLIRMATAISRYTHSKALRETIHQAAAMISRATQSVSQLPWIPETIKADLIRQEQELTHLELAVKNYQQELATEVEEAQKDLMIMKQHQENTEADSNSDSGQ